LDDDEHAVALAMRPTAASRTPIRLQGDRIDYIPFRAGHGRAALVKVRIA
jgi:hypothetical protein